ncbi:MAG: PH domain-containing protein [archaeon]
MHVVKPNKKKLFFVLNVEVLSTAILIIFLLTVYHLFEGLGKYYDWSVFGIIIFAAVFLLFKYISLLGEQFKFTDNQLRVRKSFLIFFRRTKRIPFHGISHVKKRADGFFDSMLNTGTITFDISATGQKNLKLKHMDDPGKVLDEINNAMRSHNVKTQTEYTERFKLKKELEKGGL